MTGATREEELLHVCPADEMRNGEVRIVADGRLEIGVIRQGGRYYAYRNLCPHQGGPACEGVLMPAVRDVLDADQRLLQQDFDEGDMHIVCPWHGYEYHLETGVHVGDPRLKLRKHGVIERDGAVYVVR